MPNTAERNRVKTDLPEPAGSDPNMATIASLLEKHRNALSTDFKTTISSLEAKLDCMHSSYSVGPKIASLVSNANLQDERMLMLETVTYAVLGEDPNVGRRRGGRQAEAVGSKEQQASFI